MSSVSQVFVCLPELGKPNPLELKLPGPDTRSRVVQLGSKDNTCWYAAFNVLRERYKAPNTEGSERREFERIASLRRKAVSAHECSLPDLTNQLNSDSIKNNLSSITTKSPQNSGLLAFLQLIDSGAKVKLQSILPAFFRQKEHQTLYEYLVYLKRSKRGEINEAFFAALHMDPHVLFEAMKRADPKPYQVLAEGKNWAEAPVTFKNLFSDNLIRILSATRYGLQTSSWHPHQPIEKLIDELKRCGPLVVAGCFGTSHYLYPPRKLGKQVEGREVYGWMKNDLKKPAAISGHMVLLVGAEKEKTRGYVYYIDVNDDSDPQHPEKQRIYMMSYEKLTSAESICDLHGILRNNAPEAVGYAFCRSVPSPMDTMEIEAFRERWEVQKESVNQIGLRSILV